MSTRSCSSATSQCWAVHDGTKQSLQLLVPSCTYLRRLIRAPSRLRILLLRMLRICQNSRNYPPASSSISLYPNRRLDGGKHDGGTRASADQRDQRRDRRDPKPG